MSRGYYDIYRGGEPGSGMDCLQLRQPTGPFHYLINEQAKSLVALQELQNEVGALLEFRDVVIETFPNLRTKLASTATPSAMTSNIPVAVRRDWEPGIRVRRKLINGKEDARGSAKRIGDNAVQDSGFSTETSSKETHSAPSATAATGSAEEEEEGEEEEAEDELLNLLEVIDQKGTRLKNEVEALQATLQCEGDCPGDDNFHNVLYHASPEDVVQLRKERDLLLDRLAEMEAEVLASRVHTSRLQEDLENLLAAKHDLEEQLKTVVSQRGEVNSRIRDLHLQFVTKSDDGVVPSEVCRDGSASSQLNSVPKKASDLDAALGTKLYKVVTPDSGKIAAVLNEHNPLVLQKHLLNTIVHNQVLQEKLDSASKLKVGLLDKLDKTREENEELQFQLEDKNIQLEGTRARVRMLEQLQKPGPASSPDVVPALDSATTSANDRTFTRSEITTASMKAMSPLPLNLQLDHSSSTESAHDQAESNRAHNQQQQHQQKKKPPSKIPLVKNNTSGARSRSGESHSTAHSWRSSLGRSNSSLPKSRCGSLVSARDSLTGRSPRETTPSARKPGPSGAGTVRRTGSGVRDSPDAAKMALNCTETTKFHSPWILSSFNIKGNAQQDSIDSLDKAEAERCTSAATESVWCENSVGSQYYDSIDTALTSNVYQQNGEDLAEFDSLERHFSNVS